ncbi:MAG: 3-deoxy-D-manno-octulosonic acid kinase [Ectothiorhodospiraceae bacterium]|nr:3-deoxy-D-manno-octulosonic acid kinase [Ectothiorhodospiraceae bacterium]
MKHPPIQQQGSRYWLHDPQVLDPCPDWVFEPEQLERQGLLTGTSTGRRQAWFFQYASHDLVLRHYWRGGMVARLSADVYAWPGVRRTRPIGEWRLLAALRERALPVPRPVAARVLRSGPAYRGDLITERIPQATPWDELLRANENTRIGQWRAIGTILRRFHEAGVGHADLNVRNILLDTKGAVWLIDWDRGRLHDRPVDGSGNLKRLKRSLDKHPPLARHAAAGWEHLLEGYQFQACARR